MREAIALTADVVTIVGVLALLAFLLNHPVTGRLGVWAGALRGERRYGWGRRRRGLRLWQHKAGEPLLRLLSRIGGETRLPMRPETPCLPDISPDIAQLLAPYRRDPEEFVLLQEEQAVADERLMGAAGERIDLRRWRREHRRVRCDNCGRRLGETLLACWQDCDRNEKHPKHLSHTCNRCWAEREDAPQIPEAKEPEPGESAVEPAAEAEPATTDPTQTERA